MCRSIKRLRERDLRATDEEVGEAALQFVRKISGYRSPSSANEAAFTAAVEEIKASSLRLMDSLTTRRAVNRLQARTRARTGERSGTPDRA